MSLRTSPAAPREVVAAHRSAPRSALSRRSLLDRKARRSSCIAASSALPRLFERLAQFHLLHQEVRRHRGVGLERDVDAVQLQQVARALHRALQRAVGLVHARGPLHRGAPLGVAGVREAVRMHPRLQVAVGARRARGRSSANAGARPRSSKWFSDVKGFAAAALVLHVGVVELEALVQALAREVELGAVEVRQALRVDHDLHAVALELVVLGLHRVGELELVGHARAAGGAHAEAQRHALAALGEVALDVVGGVFGERDGHDPRPPSAPCLRLLRRRASSGSRRSPP